MSYSQFKDEGVSNNQSTTYRSRIFNPVLKETEMA